MRYTISFLLASAALTTAALAEPPQVVTDIPPVQSLVAMVMEGVAVPSLLLPKGASEHAYQLRPSQAAEIAGADLVVWIGPELTPWLDGALDTRPEDAASLALLAAEGTALRDYGDAGGHDHGDHDDEGHDHSGLDPHAWLGPANGRLWVGLIAAELARIDPANAATYAVNAETAAQAIDAAEAQAAALLAPVRDLPFVAFHDAYGYYTGHFGLTLAGTVALGDASTPGAQRLAGLRDLVEHDGAVCLFPEVGHDPALIAQLAEGTGVRIGGALDPAGTALDPGPLAYGALLTGTAQVLADCLGG
jgi:zinc transport system substrate-binding protein